MSFPTSYTWMLFSLTRPVCCCLFWLPSSITLSEGDMDMSCPASSSVWLERCIFFFLPGYHVPSSASKIPSFVKAWKCISLAPFRCSSTASGLVGRETNSIDRFEASALHLQASSESSPNKPHPSPSLLHGNNRIDNPCSRFLAASFTGK